MFCLVQSMSTVERTYLNTFIIDLLSNTQEPRKQLFFSIFKSKIQNISANINSKIVTVWGDDPTSSS